MKKITEQLKSGKILVSDGAWGTLLQKRGLTAGECPELWNIEHADEVLDIAKSYIDAGADMIETNSFGGSKYKLEHFGLSSRVTELNRAAAEISRKAAGQSKFVIASIGPTGKMLLMGDVTETELYETFKEQAIALESGGANAIVVETMSDIDETKLAINAIKENTDCELICTMTFEKTIDNEYRTMMGVSPTDMVTHFAPVADIIGANCGNGIEGMLNIVKEIRAENSEIPLLIQANAGLPQYVDGKTVFNETPDDMGKMVPELIKAGVNIIGGCCGTTPEHIAKISSIVKQHN